MKMQPRDKNQVWQMVEERLGPIDLELRLHIFEDHEILDHCVDPMNGLPFEDNFDALIALIERESKWKRNTRTSGGRSSNPDDQPEFQPYAPTEAERRMQIAYCLYIEADVSQLPHVLEFRSKLPEVFFHEGDVWSFLSSPLSRLLSFEQLNAIGPGGHKLPPHRYKIVETLGSPRTVQVQIYDEQMSLRLVLDRPYSGGPTLRMERHVPIPGRHRISGAFRPNSKLREKNIRSGFPSNPLDKFPHDEESPINGAFDGSEIAGFRGTVTGETLGLGAWLADQYALRDDEAVVLLLTGKLPYRTREGSPIVVDNGTLPIYEPTGRFAYKGVGPIVLTIQPWVPAESVKQHFLYLQHSLYAGDNKPMRKGPENQPSWKSLNLFAFVCEKQTEGCRAIYAKWKVSVAGGVLPSNEFWKTYRRVRERLFPPLPLTRFLRLYLAESRKETEEAIRLKERQRIGQSPETVDEINREIETLRKWGLNEDVQAAIRKRCKDFLEAKQKPKKRKTSPSSE
ncbi:MAG: hypothetical protein SFU56_21840 [Capsulimonadales bacterium]|nr:hypothetical protein [Capsulimonadales bacterium]